MKLLLPLLLFAPLSPARANKTPSAPGLAIAAAQALVLRDARCQTRSVAADPHAVNPGATLLPVIRFDLAALLRSFDLRAFRNGTAWHLDFMPRNPALARPLGTIVVTGENTTVRELEFRRSATQRVEIIIDETRMWAVFTAEVMNRFFC